MDNLFWCENARSEREGPWALWDEKGGLLECGNYDRGRPHGLWFFFENGRAVRSVEYVRGHTAPLLVTTVKDSQGRPVGALVEATKDSNFHGQAFTGLTGTAVIPFSSAGRAAVTVRYQHISRKLEVNVLPDKITRIVVTI